MTELCCLAHGELARLFPESHTGEDCLNMLLSCFRKRKSDLYGERRFVHPPDVRGQRPPQLGVQVCQLGALRPQQSQEGPGIRGSVGLRKRKRRAEDEDPAPDGRLAGSRERLEVVNGRITSQIRITNMKLFGLFWGEIPIMFETFFSTGPLGYSDSAGMAKKCHCNREALYSNTNHDS